MARRSPRAISPACAAWRWRPRGWTTSPGTCWWKPARSPVPPVASCTTSPFRPAAACCSPVRPPSSSRRTHEPRSPGIDMIRALVSGGASPIGAAISRALARDGHHVIVHGSGNPDRARAVAAEIVSAGGSAEAVVFDLTDAVACEAALNAVLEAGPVQTVVHNAGTHDDAPMAGMSAAQWHSVVDVSLNGFFHLVRPLLLPMIGTRYGRIVAISSVSGIMGNRGQANYA